MARQLPLHPVCSRSFQRLESAEAIESDSLAGYRPPKNDNMETAICSIRRTIREAGVSVMQARLGGIRAET